MCTPNAFYMLFDRKLFFSLQFLSSEPRRYLTFHHPLNPFSITLFSRYYPNDGGSGKDLDKGRAAPLSAIYVDAPEYMYGTRFVSFVLIFYQVEVLCTFQALC